MNNKGGGDIARAIDKLIDAREFGDPGPRERDLINQAIDDLSQILKPGGVEAAKPGGPDVQKSDFGGFL